MSRVCVERDMVEEKRMVREYKDGVVVKEYEQGELGGDAGRILGRIQAKRFQNRPLSQKFKDGVTNLRECVGEKKRPIMDYLDYYWAKIYFFITFKSFRYSIIFRTLGELIRNVLRGKDHRYVLEIEDSGTSMVVYIPDDMKPGEPPRYYLKFRAYEDEPRGFREFRWKKTISVSVSEETGKGITEVYSRSYLVSDVPGPSND